MPLVRIALRTGKPPEHLRAIADGVEGEVHPAVRATLLVAADTVTRMLAARAG